MAKNLNLVEINLMMTLEVLRKIADGVYTDPAFAAKSQLLLNDFTVNPQGRLEFRPNKAQEVNEWLKTNGLIL